MRRRLLAASLAAGLTLVAADAPVRAQNAEADQFCDPSAANVILFLDVTSQYDEIDKKTLIDGAASIFDALKDGQRITIRTISDEFARGTRLLSRCVPYCADSSVFSTCTEGMLIKERRAFKLSLARTLLGAISESKELDHSEILRTIARASEEEFKEGSENLIYVFSDMIENSKYMPGKTFFSETNRELILRLADDKLIPNLRDATVRVFGFGRTGVAGRSTLTQALLDKMTDFWKLFFTASGATVSLQQNLGSAP
jgi:hypothetical protein